MKKATKVWLIVAGALVIAGLVMAGGALARERLKAAAEASPISAVEKESVAVEGTFEHIVIRSIGSVLIFPSDDDQCHLEFIAGDRDKYTAEVQDGTLTIIQKAVLKKKKWYEYIRFRISEEEQPGVTVYLPEKVYRTLTANSEYGDVFGHEAFAFENVDIATDTGNVYGPFSASGMLKIKTDTGDIFLDSLSAGDVDLHVGTGDVKMTDVTCKRLHSEGSTGDMKLIGVIASDSIDIQRSTGDIRFDGCDARTLNVKTSTGDVTGSLSSGKTFIAQSDTGRIDVPATTGGICRITTSTGDIRITVE